MSTDPPIQSWALFPQAKVSRSHGRPSYGFPGLWQTGPSVFGLVFPTFANPGVRTDPIMRASRTMFQLILCEINDESCVPRHRIRFYESQPTS